MLRLGNDEFGHAYRPNVHMTMHSPFSDLHATGNIGIVEPREIEFVTDSLGFRNGNDYAGQALFLVGDSIAMGEGATQAWPILSWCRRGIGGDPEWCNNAPVIPLCNPAVFPCWRWRKPAA